MCRVNENSAPNLTYLLTKFFCKNNLLAEVEIVQKKRAKINFTILVQECSNEVAGDTTENVFNVINAFEVPKLTYSLDRKKFLPDHTMGLPQAKLFAGNCF